MIGFGFVIAIVIFFILKPDTAFAALGMACIHTNFAYMVAVSHRPFLSDNFPSNAATD